VSETKAGHDYKREGTLGIVGGELVFMRFIAKSSGLALDPYSVKKPLYDKWIDLLEAYNS